MSTKCMNGVKGLASRNNNIDLTEFVKKLGREYGEIIYENVESPEDLQSTIDWADTNFYEGESLNYMLEDCENQEIAALFEDMEWREYKGYEDIFVEAAIEKMEECLDEWKTYLMQRVVDEYQNNIDSSIEGLKTCVDSFTGISADSILQVALFINGISDLCEECLEECGKISGCTMGAEDGFFPDLSALYDWYNPGQGRYYDYSIGGDLCADIKHALVDLVYANKWEPALA